MRPSVKPNAAAAQLHMLQTISSQVHSLVVRHSAESFAEAASDGSCDCRRRCSSMSSWCKAWSEWYRLMMTCSPLPQPCPRRGMSPPCRSSCTMCTATFWLWLLILIGCMREWQTPGNTSWTSKKRCGKWHLLASLSGHKTWVGSVVFTVADFQQHSSLLHCLEPCQLDDIATSHGG